MITVPDEVLKFMHLFQKKGFSIYLVGGAVRDLILGEATNNWDFATNATPDQILNIFPDGYYNNTFGTVGVTWEVKDKKLIFETTTFRKEGAYKDLRHPDKVEWANTVEEDLARRDFTVNAIAFDGKNLIDPYKGQEDIKKKLIVAVGNPDKRFSEDALRLIRAIRFASELGFFIEDNTRQSIQKNAALVTRISWERIRDEIFKILASDHPSEGFLFLRNTGLLTFVLPELDLTFVIPQKSPKRHHIFDVGTHLIMSLKYCPSKDPVTRFATLLHDVGKAQTFRRDDESGLITFYNHEVVGKKLVMQIADRFRLSAEQKKKLVTLVEHHQFTVSELQTDKAIRRFIRKVGLEYIDDMIALRIGDRIGSGAKPTSWRFELFKKRIVEVQKIPFSVKDLKIDGHDVMKELVLKPGPQIGKILETIFNDVEEGKLKNEREILLKQVKQFRNQKF